MAQQVATANNVQFSVENLCNKRKSVQVNHVNNNKKSKLICDEEDNVNNDLEVVNDNCNDKNDVNITFHQCQECPRSFRSAHMLNVHHNFQHASKTSESNPESDSQVSNQGQITDELVNQYDSDQFSMLVQVKYECTSCKLTFNSLEDGNIHIENNHNVARVEIITSNVQIFQCQHCNSMFETPGQCTQHKSLQCKQRDNSQILVQRFYCPHCTLHFAKRNLCIKHIKHTHGEILKDKIHTQMTTMYRCFKCLELFVTSEILETHLVECKTQVVEDKDESVQENGGQTEPDAQVPQTTEVTTQIYPSSTQVDPKVLETSISTSQSFTFPSSNSAFQEPPPSYVSAFEPPQPSNYYQAQNIVYAPMSYHVTDPSGYVIQPQVTMVQQKIEAPVPVYPPQAAQPYYQPEPVNYMEHYQNLGKAFIEMQHQGPAIPVSSALEVSPANDQEEKSNMEPNTWENTSVEQQNPPENSTFSIREVKVARFHCTACSYHFSMRHHCVRHLQSSHDIKTDSRSVYSKMTTMFECQKCLRYFQNNKLLESHICRKLSTNKKDIPFSRTSMLHYFCPLCDQHFPGGPSCRRHITLTHSHVPDLENVYRGIVTKLCSLWVCHICSTLRMKYFDCKASLAEHMIVHNVSVDSSEHEDEEETGENTSTWSEDNNSNPQWALPPLSNQNLSSASTTSNIQEKEAKKTKPGRKKSTKNYKTVVENDIMSDFTSCTQIMFVCPVCNVTNNIEFNTLHHIQTHHPNINSLTVQIPTINKHAFKCNSCQLKLGSIQECKDHKLVGCDPASQSASQVNEVRIERIHCPLCSQHFAMRHHCTRHISKAHGESRMVQELVSKVTTMYKCPKCSKLYHSIESLESHITRCKIEYRKQQSSFSKVKDELYFCPKCVQYFTSLYLCKRHISLVHPESELIGKNINSKLCSVWICHLCSSLRKKYFDKKSVLISHMRKHKIEVDIESLQDEDGSESEDISIVSDDDESTSHSTRSDMYTGGNEEEVSVQSQMTQTSFRGEPWQTEGYEPPPYINNQTAGDSSNIGDVQLQPQFIDNVSMDFYSTNSSQMPSIGYTSQEYNLPLQNPYNDTIKPIAIKQEVGTETLSFGFQILNSMSPSTENDQTQNVNPYPQSYETLTTMQPTSTNYTNNYESFSNIQYSSYECNAEVQNNLAQRNELPDSTTAENVSQSFIDEDFQHSVESSVLPENNEASSFQPKETTSLDEIESKFAVQINRSHCPLCIQHFCYQHDCIHHIKNTHPTQVEAVKLIQTQLTTMYKCETCDKLCVSATVLLNHLPKCKYMNVKKVGAYSKVYEKRYFCPYCNQHFRNSSLCERHITLVHKNVTGLNETIEQKMCYIWVCHLCSSLRTKYFDTEALLQEHMLKHKDQVQNKPEAGNFVTGDISTSEENSKEQETVMYDNYPSSYAAAPPQWENEASTQQSSYPAVDPTSLRTQNYTYQAPSEVPNHGNSYPQHVESVAQFSSPQVSNYSQSEATCPAQEETKETPECVVQVERAHCPLCHQHFSHPHNCMMHIKSNHPQDISRMNEYFFKKTDMYKCHKCDRLHLSMAALDNHSNTCKNIKTNKTDMYSKMFGFRYFCPECQLHFSTVSMCKRHVSGTHPTKAEELCEKVEKRSCQMWICHVCSSLKTKCFVTKAALVEHMLKHNINVSQEEEPAEKVETVQHEEPRIEEKKAEETWSETPPTSTQVSNQQIQSTSYYGNMQVNYNQWQPTNNFQLQDTVVNQTSRLTSEFYGQQETATSVPPQFVAVDVNNYQTQSVETNSVLYFSTPAESYIEQNYDRESSYIKIEPNSSQDEEENECQQPELEAEVNNSNQEYLENNTQILEDFTSYLRLNFPCPFCNKIYKAEASTLEHIKSQHETESYYLTKVASETEQVYECKSCHTKVNSIELCVKHKTSCTSDPLAHPPSCENENFYVSDHTENVKEYQCKTCMTKFYTVKECIEHNSICKNKAEKLPANQTVRVMRYYCSICFAHHSHRHHCYRHMVNIHGASSDALKNISYLETAMYKCDKCSKLIHSIALFKKHKASCKKTENGQVYGKIKRARWYCPKCEQHFACDGHCKRHIKQCHPQESQSLYADIKKKTGYLWICHLCSTLRTKILDSDESLKEHMLKHNIKVTVDTLEEHDTDEVSSPDSIDSYGEESLDSSEINLQQKSPSESENDKNEDFKRTTRSSVAKI